MPEADPTTPGLFRPQVVVVLSAAEEGPAAESWRIRKVFRKSVGYQISKTMTESLLRANLEGIVVRCRPGQTKALSPGTGGMAAPPEQPSQ